MIRRLMPVSQSGEPVSGLSPCQHRTVSQDGRVICTKIVEGDNSVSPSLCRACPYIAVNCTYLRFSLQQTSPSPLIVRFNGRTEVWDDSPPELRFQKAACTAKVAPIEHPRACAGCPLRQPIYTTAEASRRPQPRVVGGGKVVPFPIQGVVAASR